MCLLKHCMWSTKVTKHNIVICQSVVLNITGVLCTLWQCLRADIIAFYLFLRYVVIEMMVKLSPLQWLLLACIKVGKYEKVWSIVREKYTDMDLNCPDHVRTKHFVNTCL